MPKVTHSESGGGTALVGPESLLVTSMLNRFSSSQPARAPTAPSGPGLPRGKGLSEGGTEAF